MTATPRILLIGGGAMGALHARVLNQSNRVELAGIADPDADKGRALAERYGTRWSPEPEMLADVDAVVLASPTPTHHKIAVEVLAHGKPLLVEKPVCDDLADSEEVVAMSADRDVPLMCGLLERYNPAVLTAFSFVSEPLHVAATRHSPYAPRIRTGVAWDLLVHDVDLTIRCFGGEPDRVSGSVGRFHPASDNGAEDIAETVLGFPGGGLASVSASRVGQRKVRSLSITEIDRLVEVDLLRKAVTIYRNVSQEAATPDGRGYRQQQVIEIPELVSVAEPLATQLDRFVDLLEGKGDVEEERKAILPSHRVVARVLETQKTAVS